VDNPKAMSLAESAFHTTLRIHQRLYESTDGLIGHRILGGHPALLLRTTGRKSGQTRTNALIYANDDGRYLVVASKGGSDQAPGWLFNLRAQPDVNVQIGRKRMPAAATVIESDDPDYGRVWKLVNDNNGDRYDAYQRSTTRPIPVVALTPAA
jgi:deazaflavin-dependent oxidoreductase (nitroreductase family)